MAPTVPLQKAPGAPGAPKPPGAGAPPTGPKVEAGASTVPLAKAPGAPPKPPGSGTAPMAKTGTPGGPTQALPKATVQLAKGTQPMAKGAVAAPAAAAAARQPSEDSAPLYDEKDPEAGLAPLAIVCTILSVALAFIAVVGSGTVFNTPNDDEASAFSMPTMNPPSWEQENPDKPGTYRSTYEDDLKKIRQRYQ